ncbi:hypothetical protein ASZ90_015417 [hydrocarbon metagenome]|uniref:Uncharacterized protein n=1 Tax=hydrocarbon metagenome TaxID=938273 RepID=A0A0W8F202_9ZZZZ
MRNLKKAMGGARLLQALRFLPGAGAGYTRGKSPECQRRIP